MPEIALTALETLIADCWVQAEKETAQQVLEEHQRPPEVPLTFLFSGKLRKAVANASRVGKVASAFLQDLRGSIPRFDFQTERHFDGLIANVVGINFHNQSHEGRLSGADFGVILSRPVIDVDFAKTRIDTEHNHSVGLLAQAKLGQRIDPPKGVHRWNPLTDRQVTLFPDTSDYSSLVLYRIGGERKNELKPFGWQLCRGYTANDAQKWLRTDRFPSENTSANIIERLFARTIGTQDRKIIDAIVDPRQTGPEAVELQVFWPKGGGPPPSVPIHNPMNQNEQMLQY
jgi:hypothetical protein